MGTKVSEFMSVGPMVITAEIQFHNARPFDYASHISRGIDLGLGAIKNGSPTIHFKNYSILMHMILYYGQELGIWLEELRIT